jgi:hypothetical protein
MPDRSTLTLALLLPLALAAPALAASAPKLETRIPAQTAAPGASAAQPAAIPAGPPELTLPIERVVVFSDRARVTRSGRVTLEAGERRVRLPTLPATLDPDSVRLQTHDARLLSVELRRAGLDELPRAEAEQLLREIDKARDEATVLSDRRQALAQERELVRMLRPATSPQPTGALPPVPLEPGGWAGAVDFFATRMAADDEALLKLDVRLREQQKKLTQLCQRAAQLAAARTGEPGWVLEALLESHGGPAHLELVYVAAGARWLPAYDVRFAPGSSQVEVGMAGIVSQATGEDWADSRLVLSTAVPATTSDLPKLASWKIGDRDQLIPQPREKNPPPPPPPPPAPVRPPDDSQERDQALRRALMQAAAGAPPPANQPIGLLQAAPADIATGGMSGRGYRGMESAKRKAEAPPPEAMAEYDGEMIAEQAQEMEPSAAPAAPPPMPSSRAMSVMSKDSSSAPGAGIAFGAPRGWMPPGYSSELPAALAGGYDYTFESARTESVRSGGEARRVALGTVRFPAKSLVTVLPALRQEAYLVADVTNDSDRPLLQGTANLYVGADLQGQALLKTTASGEKVSLPLGVDEAIQVVRNVNVVQAEKGLVSRDDVTSYEVVIELLNPRRAPIDARVVDQIPLKGDQNVSIKLDKMEPWAIHDEAEGTLEWHVQLQPKEKKVLRFVYSVTRPHDAQLRQW